MSRLPRGLSYANVMATVAVFLAIGGISWAAVSLPPNSVGTKQIRNRGVKVRDLANRVVRTAKIGNGAVRTFKLGNGAVTNPKLRNGAVGGDKVANGSIGLAKTAVLDTTVTHNFGNVGANTCQHIDKTVPATVQKTDQVVVIPDATVSADAGDGDWYAGALTAEAGPSTNAPTNMIALHVCNPTGAATADPGNTTFRVLVFR